MLMLQIELLDHVLHSRLVKGHRYLDRDLVVLVEIAAVNGIGVLASVFCNMLLIQQGIAIVQQVIKDLPNLRQRC